MGAGQGKTGGQMVKIDTPLSCPDSPRRNWHLPGTGPFTEVGRGRRRVASIARRSGGCNVALDQTRLRRCIGAAVTTGAGGSAYGAVIERSRSLRGPRNKGEKQQRHENRGASQRSVFTG